MSLRFEVQWRIFEDFIYCLARWFRKLSLSGCGKSGLAQSRITTFGLYI
jgi:hypothetical protein